MAKLIVILGDQLSPALPALREAKSDDVILLAEVQQEATYVKHHKHKIILLFSAMRHFADVLRQQNYQVTYLDYHQGHASLTAAVEQSLQQHPQLDGIMLTQCGEYRLQQEINSWQHTFGLPVEILEDDRFLCNAAMFAQWADGRKQLRMEYFYREMRRYTGLLLDSKKQPLGGQWNFDKANRKSPPADLQAIAPLQFKPDDITLEVMKLVTEHFAGNPGSADNFCYAVTGKQARQAFNHFVSEQLARFGDYQDAMVLDQPFLFHSICSIYLNCGLLDVRWMCQKVEAAYKQDKVAINAAEGFIRQLIGWREYVRGLYWLLMPDYKNRNFLNANRPLPGFYWHGDTKMRCMQQAISHTMTHAYSHHIQRLMITGNFALLAGLDVTEVTDWYLAVYADAYEWVELPNTLGMALFADDGVLASKPYAASGAYINRMSNYCQHCHYKVKDSTGDDACPFNVLYWDFLARNEQKLGSNARMQLAYKNWHNKAPEQQQALRDKAADYLIKLEQL
ncbi:deoxyribodipyrimidine photolyase-related protein [Arsukibacterium tuosuense]|uniref:Deoxyribodipyrimidine photolyase-related protein n=1 Tax=Arsukibacterium tuosuense TaxID=1323745 RepID=A0A285J2N1_9GAMM|nr:cryptochrome/photolyase family protein [Arsukibacterium tuosuense]SNY54462.1 deoxyribodipyrimidine photolyase-related protein [Arsukibacterium tuosuense]